MVGYSISPVIKEVMKDRSVSYGADAHAPLKVSTVLSIFSLSFKEQVAKRCYFYKSGKLVS